MKLVRRRKLAVDTETYLIAAGMAAPPMVCTSWSYGEKPRIERVDGCLELWRAWLSDPLTVLVLINAAFDMAVVCATFPELQDLVLEAYEAGRIRCLMLEQRQLDIRNGCLNGRRGVRYRYSMAAMLKRYFGKERDKGEDTWRLRYGELRYVALSDWPTAATQYACEDASDTYDLSEEIDKQLAQTQDVTRQAYAHFALHLMSCRGIRTDRDKCLKLIEETQKEIARCRAICEKTTLRDARNPNKVHYLVDPNTGKKSLKVARELLIASLPKDTQEGLAAAVEQLKAYNARKAQDARQKVQFSHGLCDQEWRHAERRLDKLLRQDISHERLLQKWPYTEELYRDMMQLVRKPRPFKVLGTPLTKTGMVSVNADAARLSGSPALKALATYTSANTLLKKAQRMLLGADIPLQTTYVTPIATSRTSSRASDAPLVGDNFQNFRRSAMHLDDGTELPGQRECIIPRPGYVFCSIDGDAAEMRGHAQNELDLLGESPLAEVLNSGKNPHRVLGSDLMGYNHKKFERLYKDGDAACLNAAQFSKIPNFALLGGGGWRILPDYARGMNIELDDAHAMELAEAFHTRWYTVKRMHAHYKEYIHKVYEHPRTKFARYIDRYAQACNHPFQHIVASGMKWACCKLAWHQYHSKGLLHGTYSVLFMHDEVLFEIPEDVASEHAWRAARIMIEAFNEYTPDVPLTATPTLMRYFAKGAKTITHDTKRDKDGNPLLLVWGD